MKKLIKNQFLPFILSIVLLFFGANLNLFKKENTDNQTFTGNLTKIAYQFSEDLRSLYALLTTNTYALEKILGLKELNLTVTSSQGKIIKRHSKSIYRYDESIKFKPKKYNLSTQAN